MLRAALFLAFGSAVAVLFSIAVSQILLALALVALLLSEAKLRLPRIWLPLAIFLLWTLVSLAFSPDPASGLPQVRKIYVYSMLLVCFSLFRDLKVIRYLFLCWSAVGALVGARSLIQFGQKLAEARASGRDFYEYYVAERITGFMSHWMTFGGQEMFVLLMLMAYLFYSPAARKRGLWFLLFCFAVVSAALLLGYNRGIWIATAIAGIYLAWFWKRWVILVAPAALTLVILVAPGPTRARMTSTFAPNKDVDSNQHRIVTWRTGWQMIKAHPFFGLGPEQVKVQFNDYVPASLPKPLPAGYYGHLHNIYLQYAAERGVPALAALLWMLFMMLFDFWTAQRKLAPGSSDRKFILHGAIAVVLATMISGVVELNLGDSEVLMMFLVVASCGYVAVEEPAVA